MPFIVDTVPGFLSPLCKVLNFFEYFSKYLNKIKFQKNYFVEHIKLRASNQAADNHVITIFAHRKPSNSEKLLTFPQFYYVFDQESFRISHIFLFLYVLLFLLVVVTVACFLFSVTFISRQYTVNRIFVQSVLKQRQDVVFFCVSC